MQKKSLFISQHYEPEPNFIVTDVAEALAERGWKVFVITCFPNYPLGRFYDGVHWWWPKIETRNNVLIFRLPHFPDHSLSVFRRALSYLSFAAIATIVAPFFCLTPRVVWVYQTPFSTALAALFFKIIYRSKLVFMYADLWPESFIATDTVEDGFIIKVCRFYRRTINLFADVLIGSTRGTCKKITDELGSDAKSRYIPVWVGGIHGTSSEQLDSRSDRNVVYAGNLGRAQCLETIIHAAKILMAEVPDVVFQIYGSGTEEEKLKRLSEELNLKNLQFFGRVLPEIAFKALSQALAQIVILEDTKYFEMTVPSKLFMGFAAGAPILAGLKGEALRLAEESGGAFGFRSSDPRSLADAVKTVYNLPDHERAEIQGRLRKLYETEYSKNVLVAQHLQLLNTL